MIKNTFKPFKLTLYIVDPDLQANLFKNKLERKRNYKKIMLGGSNVIYGVFPSEKDFTGPMFRDIDQASYHIFNQKVIVIPIKDKKTTLMTLQIVY
jgi:hypothetical protein